MLSCFPFCEIIKSNVTLASHGSPLSSGKPQKALLYNLVDWQLSMKCIRILVFRDQFHRTQIKVEQTGSQRVLHSYFFSSNSDRKIPVPRGSL